MADSETSMSLSFVTRRGFLSGTMLAVVAHTVYARADVNFASMAEMFPSPDPAFTLWQEWRSAHELTQRLCRKQQALETRLIKTVSQERTGEIPGASKPLPREYAEDGNIASSFVANQAQWAAADAELGYSDAREAEEQAAKHEQELAEALWATPAQSLAGLAGKLDAILREGEWCEECLEFPWPQIRSALTDVTRLGRTESLMSDR